MRFAKILSLCGSIVLTTAALSTPAHAVSENDETGQTITIGDETFGSDEGLELIEHSFEVIPGESVGMAYEDLPAGGIAPMKAWGTSYAYSNEILYTKYQGIANAKGNIYQGKRVARVCFWWTRTGAASSKKTCANAKHVNGQWLASGDVYAYFNDSLGLNDPKTYFHTQIALVDPKL